MVAVAVEPYTTGMRAFDTAFVLTFALEHVIAWEYLSFIKAQYGVSTVDKVAVHYYLVKEIPFATVLLRSPTLFAQNVPPGII